MTKLLKYNNYLCERYSKFNFSNEDFAFFLTSSINIKTLSTSDILYADSPYSLCKKTNLISYNDHLYPSDLFSILSLIRLINNSFLIVISYDISIEVINAIIDSKFNWNIYTINTLYPSRKYIKNVIEVLISNYPLELESMIKSNYIIKKSSIDELYHLLPSN